MFRKKDVHKKKVLTLICFPNELVGIKLGK
jgi:hypothetical protein